MKLFIQKFLITLLVLVAFSELLSRILIDPFYFYSIDTYNLELENPGIKEVFKHERTQHVDYLFIGSSRVPATINSEVIMDQISDATAVVAGRGYMTGGIHYQAIKNRLQEFPDYLKNASVFIEYPGSAVYSTPFNEDRLKVYEPLLPDDKAMPHLLLPHINGKNLLTFIRESENSFSVKALLSLQYVSSSYRTISYVKEKFARLEQVSLFRNSSKEQLASEGGIRNDNVDFAIQQAEEYRDIQIKRISESKALTIQDLNESTLSALHTLVESNGGELFLFEMPLSSIQAEIYESEAARANTRVFEEWLENKGITVYPVKDFEYNDLDFPDTWHLSLARRDEFSSKLIDEVKAHEKGSHTNTRIQ